MRFLLLVVVATSWVSAAPVSAQRYWGPDQLPYCDRETPREVCKERSLTLLVEKLRLPPAEDLAGEGFKGIRVFYFDAFGAISPATSILARPVSEYRREGTVEAVAIQGDGEVVRMTRPIWEGAWREMDAIVAAIRQSQTEEQAAGAPGTSKPPHLEPICMDPPTTIIEVIDGGKVERLWPAPCYPSEARVQAFEVPELIAAAFPTCGHFPIERYGKSLARVAACLSVGGENPLAAIEVLEIVRPGYGGGTQVVYAAEHQSEGVRLVDADRRVLIGRTEVVEAIKAGALGNRWVRVLRASGDTSGVQLDAALIRVAEPNNPDPVPVTIRWTMEADGVWRVSEWLVGQRLEGSRLE